MIDPKEVRIGNWVIKVTGKDAHNNAYFEYRAVAIDEYFFTWAKICFPIQLTPEILYTCSFTHETYGWKLPINEATHQAHMLYLHYRSERGWYLNGLRLPCKPVYLHQLQNLYFALTGKELMIKLLPYSNANLIQPIRFNRALIRKEGRSELL